MRRRRGGQCRRGWTPGLGTAGGCVNFGKAPALLLVTCLRPLELKSGLEVGKAIDRVRGVRHFLRLVVTAVHKVAFGALEIMWRRERLATHGTAPGVRVDTLGADEVAACWEDELQLQWDGATIARLCCATHCAVHEGTCAFDNLLGRLVPILEPAPSLAKVLLGQPRHLLPSAIASQADVLDGSARRAQVVRVQDRDVVARSRLATLHRCEHNVGADVADDGIVGEPFGRGAV
mmetsp:Transcript_47542/g.132155  ORF Transcript_47542/g.132155 Transcript_47542/m.132155 type:complete len:234 (-) Transcript_47542:174-875(-)